MNLFRQIENLGRVGRYNLTGLLVINYLALANDLFITLTPDAANKLIEEIHSRASKLTAELTQVVNSPTIQKDTLLSLLSQVDELHCAADGLRDLLLRFNFPLNEQELVKLYYQHRDMIVLLTQGGLTFNEAMEHLTRSRNLNSPPMGCYSTMPGSPRTNPELWNTSMTVIVIELDLDTAPSYLQW